MRLDLTVLSFVVSGDRATLDASYQLVAPGAPGGRPILTRASAPATGNAAPDRARALSACLGALADQLAAAVARRPAVPPRHG